MKKRSLMSNQDLTKEFQKLNAQFFDNKVPGSLKVRFMKDCGYVRGGKNRERRFVEAYYDHKLEAIFIDDKLRGFWNAVSIDLLHEMTHAKMMIVDGYVGYPADAGHGAQFHMEIGRLIKAGAYDGLL
jgi:hypothetical protein